jgi:hypothetical protein
MARRYAEALADARAELEALLATRDELEVRIARVRQSIAALAALCNEPAQPELGLTDAVRSVLRGSVEALAPTDVKERVEALGVKLSSHSNALASVHTVLRRLAQSGEARSTQGYGAKTVFWWQRPVRVVPVWTDATQAHPTPSTPKGAARDRRRR